MKLVVTDKCESGDKMTKTTKPTLEWLIKDNGPKRSVVLVELSDHTETTDLLTRPSPPHYDWETPY